MPSSSTNIEDIELQTHLANCALRMSNIERFTDGSGYACTLAVKSGEFSCTRRFYFDDRYLANAIDALRTMNQGVPGEATLRGHWDEDEVKLAMNRLGHVVVSGQLFEHSELSQSLKFAFRTDQTVLGPFLHELAAIRGA